MEHEHILSSDRAGWDKLSLIYELEPAGEMPETVIPTHSIIISLGDFQGDFFLDGKWHREQYSSGDIAIIAAGDLFPRVKVDRQVPLLELFLSPQSLAEGIGEIISPKLQIQSFFRLRDPLIEQMALALKTQLEHAAEDSKLYADSMATALGVHLLKCYGNKNFPVKEYRGGLAPYQLRVIVEYIHNHLDRNLTLATLANLINISPHYFASLFKQSLGMSPHKYITQCRMIEAKNLLRQRELPIAFISQEVGFKNQSHFTRVFRQYFEITPKAYRDLG